eukprot:341543_1
MGNCMEVNKNINQIESINSENDHVQNVSTDEINITTVQQPKTEHTEFKHHESKNNYKQETISKSSTPNKDRSKLVELFTTAEDEFYEFVSDHTDKFVVVVINIMLDKTADSKHETDLETMLFHSLRNTPELWLDLDTSIKHELKRKLLIGINELEGVDRKILILAHIIGIIATFDEEWDELIPELINLKVSKDGKLKTLRMIAGWNSDRLKVHSLHIAKVIYSEILNIDDENINLFESVSLFRVMDAVIKNVDNITLLIQIMKITLVFLLKTYIINTEQLKLFDTSLNINIDSNTFNKMECINDKPFETAKICLGIIFYIQMNHFDLISLELKDKIFFLSNMFLKISASKINLGLIEFPETTNEWEQKQHDFAGVSSYIFSIFTGWNSKEKADTFDYFCRYFKEMNDDYNLIENIISNINYDIDKSVWSMWPHVLDKLCDNYNYINYFWYRKDLFIPLFSQKHPNDACFDLCKVREKLYNQEWFAVRWFVRTNYAPLYDQFHILIMEIIFKYLSQYILTSIITKEDNEMYHHPSPTLVYDVPPKDTHVYDPNSINYNVMNENMCKYKRECLIYGFIKTLKSISSYIIPETIICIIYNFYPLIIERFDNYIENDFEVQNDQTLIKLIKSNVGHTVYGQINIGPNNADIHEWKFKVLSTFEIGF